jgi:glycosyltransferase involved in cell wall biosynthesis
MPELSVVLPCYNEAGNISGILERYRPLVKRVDLELILVDNGSSDGTSEVIDAELSKSENAFAKKAVVVTNIGYGHGIQTGLETARSPIVAFSHADLQCPPEDCVTAFEIYRDKVKEGGCLVKGRRRGARPVLDQFVTTVYNGLGSLILDLDVLVVETGLRRIPDLNAEPKLFARELIPDLGRGPIDFTYDLYAQHLAKKKRWTVYEFDVSYDERTWGKSKLATNPWIKLKQSMNAFYRMVQMRFGFYA